MCQNSLLPRFPANTLLERHLARVSVFQMHFKPLPFLHDLTAPILHFDQVVAIRLCVDWDSEVSDILEILF